MSWEREGIDDDDGDAAGFREAKEHFGGGPAPQSKFSNYRSGEVFLDGPVKRAAASRISPIFD